MLTGTRQAGARRKRIETKDATLLPDLLARVDSSTRGDPESALRWTCKSLRGARFSSTEQLTQAIEAFVTQYNKTAAPFIWRKREVKGSQLRNTIVNLRN